MLQLCTMCHYFSHFAIFRDNHSLSSYYASGITKLCGGWGELRGDWLIGRVGLLVPVYYAWVEHEVSFSLAIIFLEAGKKSRVGGLCDSKSICVFAYKHVGVGGCIYEYVPVWLSFHYLGYPWKVGGWLKVGAEFGSHHSAPMSNFEPIFVETFEKISHFYAHQILIQGQCNPVV